MKYLFKLGADIDQMTQIESLLTLLDLQDFFEKRKYPYLFYNTLADNSPVPRERGERHIEPGWYVSPGTYKVVIAHSASNSHTVVDYTLTGEETRQNP